MSISQSSIVTVVGQIEAQQTGLELPDNELSMTAQANIPDVVSVTDQATPINASPETIPKAIATATNTFRERDHRFTALPVKDILKIRMKELGIKNPELQTALGYPAPNVIAMMKSGTMRLPATKAPATAALLKVDPVFLLAKVLAENDAALWEVIESLLGTQLVSANEMALINLIRQGLDGHDVNLAQSPVFVRAIKPQLAAIAKRETALVQAAINRQED